MSVTVSDVTSTPALDGSAPDASAQRTDKAPETDTLSAIMLFVDLAGYSRMSAELVSEDTRGAEEIIRVLNRGFNPYIDIIADHGGMVASTSGDALFAFWPVGDDLDAAQAQARAAAEGIQALPDIEYAGGRKVSAKILLDYGEVRILTLGGHQDKFARVLAGDLFAQLNETSAAMQPQQIITTARFEAAERTPESKDYAPAMFQDSLGYINQPQVQGLRPTEFRAITALFIKLPMSHLDDPATAQSVAHTVQQAVASQQGAVLQYQSDDKGVVVVAAWGVPNTAHEDKSARAVFAGQSIVSVLHPTGTDVQMGIAAGDALAGEIGNAHFRQYTVLSDVVNTAAALAVQARAGQILCDRQVADAAQTRFAFAEAVQFTSKGRDAPIVGLEPAGELRANVGFANTIIGRQAEIDAVLTAFAQATPEHRPVVRVVAAAGLGKSHLGAVLTGDLTRSGFRCLHGTGDALRKATAYGAWKPIFAALTDALSPADLRAHLGDNAVHLSLLSSMLDQTEAEDPETEALSPAARGTLTNDMAIDLLRCVIGPEPAVLVFEDTHWIDSASWGVIAHCRNHLPQLGILLLTRPVADADQPMTALDVLYSDDVTTVLLHPLDRAGSDLLVAAQLGAKDIVPALGAQIFDLAAGHPLYTKELTNVTLARGIVTVSNGYCQMSTQQLGFEHEGFPKDLGATLAERIDTLTPMAQQLIKLAAVQGRQVDMTILREVSGHADAELSALLSEIAAQGLLESSDDARWMFHHILITEAAYQLLLSDEQQQLHRKIAAAIEADPREKDHTGISLLAHHWTEGRRPKRALPYLDTALHIAHGQHANDEVLRYGKRALALAEDHSDAVTEDQVGAWHNALQIAYKSQGHLVGTDEHLRAITATFDQPTPTSTASTLARTIGEFFRFKLGRKIKGKSRDAQLRAAAAYLSIAEVAYDRQDTLNVLYGTLRGTNLAISAGGTSVEMATANAQMAMTAVYVRFALDGDKLAAQAEDMVETIDDEGAKAWIYMVLSAYQFSSGRFDRSCDLADEAIASSVTSREAKTWEYAAAGKANVLRLMARFAECDALDARVYESGHDRAVPQVKLWGTVGRLKNLWITNQFDLFEQWLDRSGSLLSDELNKLNSATSNTIGHHIFSALHHLRHGNTDGALTELMETKRLFEGLRDPQLYMVDPLSYIMDAVRGLRHAGGAEADILTLTDFVRKAAKNTNRLYPMCWARLHLAQGDWHESRGDRAKAVAAWTKAAATDGPVDIPFDNAMAHYRLAHFGGLSASDSAAHSAAVTDILARLDVALPVSWTL